MKKQQPLFKKKVSLIIRISEGCIKTPWKRVTKCKCIFYFNSVPFPTQQSTLQPWPGAARPWQAGDADTGHGLWHSLGCRRALPWAPQLGSMFSDTVCCVLSPLLTPPGEAAWAPPMTGLEAEPWQCSATSPQRRDCQAPQRSPATGRRWGAEASAALWPSPPAPQGMEPSLVLLCECGLWVKEVKTSFKARLGAGWVPRVARLSAQPGHVVVSLQQWKSQLQRELVKMIPGTV